jgi:DNA-binding MarR family transcriptional regulator
MYCSRGQVTSEERAHHPTSRLSARAGEPRDQSQLEARLRQEGVPVEQWRILKVLSDGKGHSMGELAETVLLNHPTLTKMIDRMVSDSLVYRLHDLDDRRKVAMYCSDRSKELAKRLNLLAQSQETHIAENYGDRATEDLKRLLETLIDSAS